MIIDGLIEFVPVTPMSHLLLKLRFGRKFPTTDELKLSFDSNYFCLTNPVTIRVKTESEWLHFEFSAGFTWDCASVPRFLRSIVDDNAQCVIASSLIHDYSFSSKVLSFRDANKIFKGVIEKQGGNKVESLIYWLGVSSPVGKFLYKHSTDKRSWHLDFCTFTREEI